MSEPETVTRRVMWEVDVEFPADADDRHIAESVAKAYFQDRIANGESGTSCVFKVMRHDLHDVWSGREVDLSK